MNDLKLTGKSEEQLQKQMHVTRTFSDDIHMEFGLDKCAKIVLKRGKLVHSHNLMFDLTEKYKSLNRLKHTSTLGLKRVRADSNNK
jgi:hypothetical protein